ncbi:thioredoxin-like protein [Pilaira anomala]|nr:thioredoxin-like protein [Pilaira anomala]
MWPFNLVWKLSWRVFQIAAHLLYRPSITASRRDPRSEADRFLRDFEFTYGTTHPKFFEGGYTQALRVAKQDLVYLVVFLSSEEHDDHDTFCRETMTNPELISFLNTHQVLVWGGNVRYTEAFQVSNTLQATTYPFLAIVALQTTHGVQKMSVIDRMEGPTTAANVMRRLESAMARVDVQLNQLRNERAQREAERMLREEQDKAYRQSLLADQEKERKLKEEREAKARAKERKELRVKQRQEYIQYLVSKFKTAEESKEKMTKISFRLADGERVIRKFDGNDSLETLYQFVEAYPYLKQYNKVSPSPPVNYQHEYKFSIHSSYPRTVYEPNTEIKIKDQKGLWPSATLIVDSNEEAEEEEDDDEDEDDE